MEIPAQDGKAIRKQLDALLARGVQFSVAPSLGPGGLRAWVICWPEPAAQAAPADDAPRSA